MDDRSAEDSDQADQDYAQANTLKFSKIKECLSEGFDAFETERIIQQLNVQPDQEVKFSELKKSVKEIHFMDLDACITNGY